MVVPPPSSRPALRTLGVARRRESLSWQTAVGLLVAALLSNAVGVYSTSSALMSALDEPEPKPKPERLTNFDLVDPNIDSSVAQVDQPNGLQPETERKAEVDSDVDRETQAPPPQPTTKTANRQPDEEKQGEQDGEQNNEPGDDSLVEANDGTIASDGVDSGNRQGRPDPLSKLGGSPSVLDQTFGRPGADDRMRDVDEGAENMLDSKRHLFGSFFNRLRDRVSENWRPEKAHKAADPNGTRYGDTTRMTVLMVRLDENGKILKIEVEHESGAPHLDEEAERAMRAAAPFPNLPEGLADENGHVDFRFGFILDFNGGSRIFRYQN